MMVDTSVSDQRPGDWDHSSSKRFVDYYAENSKSQATIHRFTLVRDKTLGLLARLRPGSANEALRVADIGCGTGTQARLWAMLGHRVSGVDVNSSLVGIAKERAQVDGLEIDFEVGSATELPWPDASMSVVLLPELLEHVAEWQQCLDEAVRILEPGGVLYLSTTNFLCPFQDEFELPLYSWYPAVLKRRFERLAVTSRPELANHCKYPAVNWFSYYGLSSYLETRELRCFDRFEMIEASAAEGLRRYLLGAIRRLPPLRFLAQMATKGSVVFAVKKAE